jgi:hypothetical protein
MDERLMTFLDKLDYDGHAKISEAIDAALYALAVTYKEPNGRSAFIQDLAAALGRRGILPADQQTVERFWQLCEDRVNNINMSQRVNLETLVTH